MSRRNEALRSVVGGALPGSLGGRTRGHRTMSPARKGGRSREGGARSRRHSLDALRQFIRGLEGSPMGSLLCVPRGCGPGTRSDLDIGQGDITLDLQSVHLLEGREPMGVVKEVLAVGVNLEAIQATADGQLQGEGRESQPGQRLCTERGKRPTHIKELAETKGVVGDLLLLRTPRAVHIAVPHHSALGQTGVNVESQVPRGPHLEVDRKSGDREGDEGQKEPAPGSPREGGAGHWTPGPEGEDEPRIPTSV